MTSKKHMAVAAFLAVAALAGAACSDKVDREGTRDQIVEGLEEQGIEVDGDCIDEIFEEYTDDELQAADDALNDDEDASEQAQEDADAIIAAVPGCIVGG